MTIQGVPDAEADARWRDWVARGAASDRRTSKRMTGLSLPSSSLVSPESSLP